MANIVYVRQRKHFPYGNGTPLLAVKDLIEKDEAFVFMWGDDMVKSKVPAVKQIVKKWASQPGSIVLGAQEVEAEEVNRYGIVKLKKGSKDEVEGIVEKPDVGKAPSRLAQYGRFVLNHKVIDILWENFEAKKYGRDNELWLTDAIAQYIKKGGKTLVAEIKGKWMTTGDPLRYLMTTVEYALDREDIGKEFKEYLVSLDLGCGC